MGTSMCSSSPNLPWNSHPSTLTLFLFGGFFKPKKPKVCGTTSKLGLPVFFFQNGEMLRSPGRNESSFFLEKLRCVIFLCGNISLRSRDFRYPQLLNSIPSTSGRLFSFGCLFGRLVIGSFDFLFLNLNLVVVLFATFLNFWQTKKCICFTERDESNDKENPSQSTTKKPIHCSWYVR